MSNQQIVNKEVKMINAAISDKPRITITSYKAQDLQSFTESTLAFAIDLYHALRKQDGNLFFSPHSIYQALSMTYAGARGQTEKEITETLHITLPQDRLHAANNSLSVELSRRSENAKGKDGKRISLKIVNAIWGQQDYTFLPEYLDTLAQYYGAGIYLLDFENAPEPPRLTINEWVSEQTENKIQNLLPAGSIDELTRMVLTNAIYFNVAWGSPFEEEFTTPDKFYLLDGSTIKVQMMKQTHRFGYSEGSNYQAVRLPYRRTDLSMVILLPKEGEFNTFEKSMNQQTLTGIMDSILNRKVALSMPKFEYNMSVGLREILSAMGMPSAFSADKADFSGINGNRELFISDAVHKAFIAVDEEGTEAAAATGISYAGLGIPRKPEEPVKVTVNRPFVFLIRDVRTGTILFIGRVLNPSN
ncbi:MAG TPA: serpin family protein [Dehalococcoidia bacterium]|nr:serpin family protein [Dehalococcoidia bacterium]